MKINEAELRKLPFADLIAIHDYATMVRQRNMDNMGRVGDEHPRYEKYRSEVHRFDLIVNKCFFEKLRRINQLVIDE